MIKKSASQFGLLILAMGFLSPAWADDGTIDIKIQPASTYIIDRPGSYLLVDDVTMDPGLMGVFIQAADVILDMGGHTITGGGGVGVPGIMYDLGTPGAGERVTIFNGQVRGFSGEGIRLTNIATIHDMVVVNNGNWGIIATANATVRACKLLGNNIGGGSGGVSVGIDSIVENCVVGNMVPLSGLVIGISILAGSSAIGNNVTGCGSLTGNAWGISATGNRCTIHRNSVVATATNATLVAFGIDAGDHSVITNNTVSDTQSQTNVYGIDAGSGCLIEGNTCANNDGMGASGTTAINALSGCTIRNNVCYDNDNNGSGSAYGILTGPNCLIESNACTGQSEGPSGAATAYGIFTTQSEVINNACGFNNATGGAGNATGIRAGDRSLVRGNRCVNNTGQTGGVASGIEVANRCRVEGNHCTDQATGTTNYGIIVTASDNLILNNSTSLNPTAGINLAGPGNRSELNRTTEAAAPTPSVINGGDDSLGTGELADLGY